MGVSRIFCDSFKVVLLMWYVEKEMNHCFLYGLPGKADVGFVIFST